MADDAGASAGEDPARSSSSSSSAAAEKKQRRGIFSRIWRGIFGVRSEDYEKRLQYLSKEEAAVHARMKRRAQSSRRMVRNLIVLSVIVEVRSRCYLWPVLCSWSGLRFSALEVNAVNCVKTLRSVCSIGQVVCWCSRRKIS